jgi:intracellular multiplication protein IcmX
MMKLLGRLVLSSILILNASAGYPSAGGGGGSDAGGAGGQDLADLVKYFLNLGSFLGYNLQNDPTDSGKTKISYKLLSPTPETDSAVPPVQLINNIVFNNFLGGSFLVNTIPTVAQVISDAAGGSYPDYVNPFASYSFNPQGLLKQGSYATQSQAGISISALIDQPPYQSDPVAQSVLNILGTPDYSYCMDNAEKQFTCDYNETNNNSTKIINEYQVMANAIGTPLPGTNDYFTFSHIEPLLGQLNANSLITPLMYSNAAFQQQQNNNNETNKTGLKAMSQEQQAANFIRYVSGAVAPIVMPDRNVFDKWVTIAKQPTSVVQQQAQAIIATYLTALRVYAAQVSVGVSNLYYIMSKRLPQGEEGKAKSSQALSEFKMASWRLYNPGQTEMKSQWISQINNASAASVQKEMAVLLAEINYQLYLNRQQDERILLTNTLLLLQNSRAAQPNTQLNPPSTGVLGTQGSF